jgi:hypothetical protein
MDSHFRGNDGLGGFTSTGCHTLEGVVRDLTSPIFVVMMENVAT